MNLFGLLLIRKDQRDFMSTKDYNHEQIHTAQYRELGYLFFLPIYIIEWFIKLFYYRFNAHHAYRAISFELKQTCMNAKENTSLSVATIPGSNILEHNQHHSYKHSHEEHISARETQYLIQRLTFSDFHHLPPCRYMQA